jgi:hypothetical protein
MSRRDEMLTAVLAAAKSMDDRLLALTEYAKRNRRRVTDSDVRWCRQAIIAEVENERAV